jgi:hypothetical protein
LSEPEVEACCLREGRRRCRELPAAANALLVRGAGLPGVVGDCGCELSALSLGTIDGKRSSSLTGRTELLLLPAPATAFWDGTAVCGGSTGRLLPPWLELATCSPDQNGRCSARENVVRSGGELSDKFATDPGGVISRSRSLALGRSATSGMEIGGGACRRLLRLRCSCDSER